LKQQQQQASQPGQAIPAFALFQATRLRNI